MWSTAAERTAAAPWRGASFWKPLWHGLAAALRKVRVQKKPRSLSMQETLPLGERRFLAVVQWGNEKLLLGVTPQGISLLESRAQKKARGFAWEEEPGA
jgi:hypothetical protein